MPDPANGHALPDSRVRRRKARLVRVTDQVWCGTGYSVSNVSYVLTRTSVVAIDTTESITAARQSLDDLRAFSPLPVSHIVFTHFHGDHIRGAAALRLPGTVILAHRLMPEELESNNLLLAHRERVNAVQLGTPLPVSVGGPLLHDPEDGALPPDVLVDDLHRLEQGDEEFVFLHVPGETRDHLAVWMPGARVLFCGDLFYRAFPMLSNPFKRDRPVADWIRSLERLDSLGADHLVPSHGRPVSGRERVTTMLSTYADAIRHVHDETLRCLGKGLSVEQAAQRIGLPAPLARLPYLQERYGTVSWAVKGIARQHVGWFDGNPATLNPAPRHAVATALVGAAGRPAPFVQRAVQALEQGHDQVALELADMVLDAQPGHRRARSLRLAALGSLAARRSNALERNVYAYAAREAEGDTSTGGDASTASRTRLLFVLAPPRSFTSIVGTMIGQHPQLYGLPETHLFGCETMSEWWRKCEEQTFPRADGLVRAVAQLVFSEQTDATVDRAVEWLRRRSRYTTAMLMEVLASRAAPRTIVDKSPSLVYSVSFLDRIRKAFPEARFLHLTRHPRSQGESVLRYLEERRRLGPVPPTHWLVYLSTYPHAPRNDDDGDRPLDPQHGWLALNRNILGFLESVPEEQQLVARGEDLLRAPDDALPRIAEWLGLRTDAAAIEEMKHPERSPFAQLGPAGARYGNDLLFLENPTLRPDRAAPPSLDGPVSWRDDGAELLPEVKDLAQRFGYV